MKTRKSLPTIQDLIVKGVQVKRSINLNSNLRNICDAEIELIKSQKYWDVYDQLHTIKPDGFICNEDFINYPSDIVQVDFGYYYARIANRSDTSYAGGGPGWYRLALYSPKTLKEAGIRVIQTERISSLTHGAF